MSSAPRREKLILCHVLGCSGYAGSVARSGESTNFDVPVCLTHAMQAKEHGWTLHETDEDRTYDLFMHDDRWEGF